MKQEFDRLEEFRKAINYEGKLYCNVDEAYTREKAAELLQQLVKSWKMDEENVITVTTQRVCNTIDKQFRDYVLRFMDLERIPYSEQEIKRRWEALTTQEKDVVLNGIINYIDKYRK